LSENGSQKIKKPKIGVPLPMTAGRVEQMHLKAHSSTDM